jgi:hypothetical protein
MIDPKSKFGVGFRACVGILVGVGGIAMVIFELRSGKVDIWSVVGSTFVAVVGFAVVFAVRQESNRGEETK